MVKRHKASLHVCTRVPRALVHHLLSLSQSSRSLALTEFFVIRFFCFGFVVRIDSTNWLRFDSRQGAAQQQTGASLLDHVLSLPYQLLKWRIHLHHTDCDFNVCRVLAFCLYLWSMIWSFLLQKLLEDADKLEGWRNGSALASCERQQTSYADFTL
jgi:hypothetical protein